MKSRIDSNSATLATEYGEVETLDVKESMRIQHTTEMGGIKSHTNTTTE